jgi:hypothetical protein
MKKKTIKEKDKKKIQKDGLAQIELPKEDKAPECYLKAVLKYGRDHSYTPTISLIWELCLVTEEERKQKLGL